MMNETLALFSYGWTRYERIAKIIFAVTAVSLALTGSAWALEFPKLVVGIFGQCTMFGLFGCFMLPVGLFSMSHGGSMLNAHSGYDTWLLRLPIPSWKLAVIPALLVTAWLTVLWLMIAVPVQLWEEVRLPILSQIMAMSSGAIFVISLIWKPQRWIWLRGIAFLVAVPFSYVAAFGCIGVAMEAPEFMPLVVIASPVCYAASLAFAIYSVKLARVSAFQQSRSVKSLSVTRSNRTLRSRDFKSLASALAWHDSRRAKLSVLGMTAIIVPVLVFTASILPLNGATAIVGLMFASAMCVLCAVTQVEPTVAGDRSSLPSYLIASPIASSVIAYSRLRSVSTTFLWLFLLMSMSLLLSLVWESNFATAERWWANTQAALSVSAPIRIILFTHFVTLVASLGLLLRFVSVQMYGRHRLVISLSIVTALSVAAPLIVGLGWFLKQTNWEEVTQVTTSWLHWSYNLIYVTLALKICVDVFIISWAETRLVSRKAKFQFVLGWSMLVIGTAVTAWMIWPAPSFTTTTALMASAIVIPLSPFLLAPVAVDANRHRSIPIGSAVRTDC